MVRSGRHLTASERVWCLHFRLDPLVALPMYDTQVVSEHLGNLAFHLSPDELQWIVLLMSPICRVGFEDESDDHCYM